MFLLVPAHLGCPGQNPESHKTVVCVCVIIMANGFLQVAEFQSEAHTLVSAVEFP